MNICQFGCDLIRAVLLICLVPKVGVFTKDYFLYNFCHLLCTQHHLWLSPIFSPSTADSFLYEKRFLVHWWVVQPLGNYSGLHWSVHGTWLDEHASTEQNGNQQWTLFLLWLRAEGVIYMGTGICLFFLRENWVWVTRTWNQKQKLICHSDLGTIRLGIVFDYLLTIRS